MPLPSLPKLARRQFLFSGLSLATGFLVSGCGTILHPERRGQPAGRLDWGIVALDAIGLLLFFVPGVIAFAVDFSNGTIYLPPDHYGSADPPAVLVPVEVGTQDLTPKRIGQEISQHLNQEFQLVDGKYETHKLQGLEQFWKVRDELLSS